MGLIVIIPFLALATWSIFATARWLRRGGYGREWWKRFAFLAAVGLALGVWFAGFARYSVAKIQLEGFPIPLSIESPARDDAPATKSAMPAPIRISGMITNLLCGVALCLAPIPLALFLKENRTPLPGANRRAEPPS